MSDYYDWLKNLKPGNKVIMNNYYGETIAVVERTTKTQIVLKGIGVKFKKSSGYRVGGDVWSTMSINEATPERIAEVQIKKRKQFLRQKIKELFPKIDSLDKLEQIYEVMKDES